MGASAKPPRSLKARALQLLAQREQSRVELRRKLLAAAEPDEAADLGARVEVLLDWLDAQGYLSPERFAEARVHARAARHGNRRILHELQQHQVKLTPEAAQALEASEMDRARAVWQRKFQAAPPDAAERAKQARFLIGRGFSAEVVHRLLRDSEGPDDVDTAGPFAAD